jgi:hypothetical protein
MNMGEILAVTRKEVRGNEVFARTWKYDLEVSRIRTWLRVQADMRMSQARAEGERSYGAVLTAADDLVGHANQIFGNTLSEAGGQSAPLLEPLKEGDIPSRTTIFVLGLLLAALLSAELVVTLLLQGVDGVPVGLYVMALALAGGSTLTGWGVGSAFVRAVMPRGALERTESTVRKAVRDVWGVPALAILVGLVATANAIFFRYRIVLPPPGATPEVTEVRLADATNVLILTATLAVLVIGVEGIRRCLAGMRRAAEDRAWLTQTLYAAKRHHDDFNGRVDYAELFRQEVRTIASAYTKVDDGAISASTAIGKKNVAATPPPVSPAAA